MAPSRQPTPEDRADAIAIALSGIASGEESGGILSKLTALRVRNNTFPAEELLELAADAIDESGATQAEPLDSENIRERLLPEHPFSGKTQHYKSKYAISAAAMFHGGVYPDLLDDAAWWEADDLWTYSFFALMIYVRAAAERTDRPSEATARSIADRRRGAVDHPRKLTDSNLPRTNYPPATKATTT
jgi:hypothetical protein